MRPTSMVLFCLLCCAVIAPIAAQDALPADPIAQVTASFRTELARQAAAYDGSLLPLAEEYLLSLRRLSDRLKQAGDNATMEGVRKEAARFMQALAADPDPFEPVPELAQDAFSPIEAIRLLQEEYVGRRKAAELTRNERVHDAAGKVIAAFERLHDRFAADGATAEAAAARKEANRLRVVLQRKDFAQRLFEEAGAPCRMMPPPPDVANLRERADAPAPALRNLAASALQDLPAPLQAFLLTPFEYDSDWPPEVTKWEFEGSGPYSHDFAHYRTPGLPNELGIFVYPRTMKAYVRGAKRVGVVRYENQPISWLGQAMAWRLKDSRDLVCTVVFRTRRPAVSEATGPAACVAVYSINENNRLIASMSAPMLAETTTLRMAKHYSYNRMNIVWEGSRRKRGFTIPNHMPMRVVIGIAAFAAGEEVDATIEILPCTQLGDMW